MVAPDVQIEDGKGTILISSEEGETEGERKLSGGECIAAKSLCSCPKMLSELERGAFKMKGYMSYW